MLNQLADEGVDVDEAKQDPCLLANLSRVNRVFCKQNEFLTKLRGFQQNNITQIRSNISNRF